MGRRIQKRLVDNQGGETIRRYVYDGEDLLFEYDGNGQLITEYIHGPGIDEPLAMRRNGETYSYHADALGSIIAITDEGGALVQQYTYDAYGAITFMLDPAFEQPYGFTGREYDAESGLYFYRARYYDPNIGRFITRDPIGFAGGDVNLYRYVLNDPVNLIDPSGRVFNLATGVAGGIVGAVVGGATAFVEGGDVGAGVLTGALSGAATGLTFGGSLLFGATFGAITEASNQRLSGDCFSSSKIFKSAVFGATGSAIGGVAKGLGVGEVQAGVIGVAGGGFGAIVQGGINALN